MCRRVCFEFSNSDRQASRKELYAIRVSKQEWAITNSTSQAIYQVRDKKLKGSFPTSTSFRRLYK